MTTLRGTTNRESTRSTPGRFASMALLLGSLTLTRCGADPYIETLQGSGGGSLSADGTSDVTETPNAIFTPTSVTLLRTGNLFLGYVSIPDGDSCRDKEDALVTFNYQEPSGRWRTIPSCESVFTCDISGLPTPQAGSLRLTATFSPEEGSSYAASSAEYTLVFPPRP